MKLTIKTIKGEVFSIDAESNDKISDLKLKIQNEKQFEAGLQKLIVKGKNTEDDATCESLGLKDGDFLVVMVSKKPAGGNTQPSTQPKPSNPDEKMQPESNNDKPSNTNNTSNQSNNQGGGFDSGMVIGEAYNNAVQDIVAMGFTKEEVEKAMKAAYNVPERAIDYLFNGIPEQQEFPNLGGGGGSQSTSQQQQQGGNSNPFGDLSNLGSLGGGGQQQQQPSGPLANVANNPMFQQLRAAIQQNPEILPQVLGQIQQSNPELFQLISQNQQEFMQLLLNGGGDDEGDYGDEGEEGVVQVTKEENDAIERLCAMGFEKNRVLEAFLACDRNEEMAANYLLEGQFEDFSESNQGGNHGGHGGDDDNLFDQ